jgi:hypothetical protein
MRPAINLAPSNVTGMLASVTQGATPPNESTGGRAIAATCGHPARFRGPPRRFPRSRMSTLHGDQGFG